MATAEQLITVACGKCGHESRVVASFAGQAGKCPKCREVVIVPDAATAAAARDAKELAAAETAAQAQAVAEAFTSGDAPTVAMPATDLLAPVAAATPAAATAGADERACRACSNPIRKAAIKCRFCGDIVDRPCPTCGEEIKATAKKCRFCGEFLDASMRSRRRQEDHGFTLAEPAERFYAWLLDLGVRVPYYVALVLWFVFLDQRNDVGIIAAAASGSIYYLVLTVVEWSMITRSGQTVGKRWRGIRIVRTDGTPCDFVHGVVLRSWIYAVLGNPLFLSFLAVVLWGIDAMMVFGEDRRSLRDHIASTRVVVIGK